VAAVKYGRHAGAAGKIRLAAAQTFSGGGGSVFSVYAKL